MLCCIFRCFLQLIYPASLPVSLIFVVDLISVISAQLSRVGQILETVRDHIPSQFRYYVKLNKPPLGWSEGVGFIEKTDVIKHLVHPSDDALVVMCGPPIFEDAMRKTLLKCGFSPNQYYSYAEGDNVAARL